MTPQQIIRSLVALGLVLSLAGCFDGMGLPGPGGEDAGAVVLPEHCKWLGGDDKSGVALCRGVFAVGYADTVCPSNRRVCRAKDVLSSKYAQSCWEESAVFLTDIASYHAPTNPNTTVCSSFNGWLAGLSGCGRSSVASAQSAYPCLGWQVSFTCSRVPGLACGNGIQSASNADANNGVACCLFTF